MGELQRVDSEPVANTQHIVIISCGLGPESLTALQRAAVLSADVLSGGERLLSWFPEFCGERVPIGAHAVDTVTDLVKRAETGTVAVLASGDSLFFGIARLFLHCVPATSLKILPNVTAAQAALSELCIPWEKARFFSVHGRDAVLPWREVLRAPLAVVYCDSRRSPASVAAALIAAHPASAGRAAAVAVALGSSESRVSTSTLGAICTDDAAGMSMLILLSHDSAATIPVVPLGQSDDCFAHEGGLITHPEVRAVALSKLSLRGGVLWDLGAGSGSVSVEAAGLCPGLRVYAVERKASRCEQIRENATAAGLAEYEVIEGEIIDSIAGLPAPDAVFVGGGGKELAQVVAQGYELLRPGGVLVAAAVLEESQAALHASLPGVEPDICQLSISHSSRLGEGTLMRPQHAIYLFSFRKDYS